MFYPSEYVLPVSSHRTEETTMNAVSPPKPITEDEFLTLPEIAFMSRNPRTNESLQRGSVEQWRVRNRGTDREFLKPDDHIGAMPIWRLSRVLAWMDAQNRPYDVEAWRERRAAGGFRRHQDLL